MPTSPARYIGAVTCPNCAVPLVTLYANEPWCGRCDWGLDRLAPDPEISWIYRWRGRLLHRLGSELNRSLFGRLAGAAVGRPRLGGGELLLIGLSTVIGMLLLMLAAAGGYLIVTGNVLFKILGALSIGVAVLMRPRLGRLKSVLAGGDELTREQAPRLFALLDQVATAAGAPLPHHVLLCPEWNAGVTTIGLRRRRIVLLGLPLWAVLRPQERVALLGHEFGHLVNNDLRRGLASTLALTSFWQVADLLLPTHTYFVVENLVGLATRAVRWLMYPVLWSAAQLAWLIHLGLNMLGARNGQRAEYYADAIGARIGGSTAMQGALDVLMGDSLFSIVASRARGRQLAAGWRAAADETRQEQRPRLALLRQLTLRRDASPLASHPPAGLRHRMIASRPHESPQVVLSEHDSTLIDAELARYEESCRRVIAEQW